MPEYYILVKHFYYPGTFFAPKDGPLLDCNEQRMEFSSQKEAGDYLCSVNWHVGMYNYKGNQYCADGDYWLSHGEYARPEYHVRKVREVVND